MTILLAILSGMGLGYIVERGDFCFHSTWRDMLRQPRQPDLFRAYLLLLLISVPLVQGLIAWGWIEPWIPPFVWKANLLGGLLFGVGMVVAATCITGVFYKLGHGMLGMIVALAAWALGDMVTYLGPLALVREALTAAPVTVNGASATLLNAFGWPGMVLLGALGLGTAVYLFRAARPSREKLWDWLRLGLVMGLFMSAAWLLARTGGSNYTFGTSGVPSGIFTAITEPESRDAAALWIPISLIFVIPGAFIASKRAGTLWVRGETNQRYTQLAVGGFMMGVGAAIAGGCNLGHGMVGVSLLSLGSILSTASIIAGVFLADRAFKLWQKWVKEGTDVLPANG